MPWCQGFLWVDGVDVSPTRETTIFWIYEVCDRCGFYQFKKDTVLLDIDDLSFPEGME